jgi:hypothetical protein
VRKTGEREVSLTITEDFSPAFTLNALAARCGAIVDQVEATAHEPERRSRQCWLGENLGRHGRLPPRAHPAVARPSCSPPTRGISAAARRSSR